MTKSSGSEDNEEMSDSIAEYVEHTPIVDTITKYKEPDAVRRIAESRQRYFTGTGIDIVGQLHSKSEDWLRRIAHETKYVYAQQLPAGSKYLADTICDFYFGSLMLAPEKKGSRVSETLKLHSASLQKDVVNALFYATAESQPDSQYVKKVFDSIAFQDALAQSQPGIHAGVGKHMSGYLSEARIINALRDNNDTIILPGQGYEDEVLEWDVRSGIDHITLREDASGSLIAVLVDAKGEADYSNYILDEKGRDRKNHGRVVGEQRTDTDVLLEPERFKSKLPKSAQDVLNDYGVSEVYRATVVVPSNPRVVGDMGYAYTQANGALQESLHNIITLPGTLGIELNSAIDDGISYRQKLDTYYNGPVIAA